MRVENPRRLCLVAGSRRRAMSGDAHALAFDKARRLVARAGEVAAAACLASDGALRCAVHSGSTSGPAGGEGPWFRIGSLTKTLVAFAALDFALRAGHDPGADIGAELALLLGGRLGAPVSLRALLSHTAGLNNCSVLDEPLSVLPAAHSLVRSDARGRFSYSNIGYALAGMWLCHRTGLDFAGWLHRHALRPLQLSGIAMRPPPASHRAIGHVLDPWLGGRRALALREEGGPLAPAGYLWATPEGLGQLLQALLHPPDASSAQVVALMTAVQSPVFGPGNLSAGAGVFIVTRGKRRLVFNEGEIGGFRSRIELDLTARTGLAEIAAFSGPLQSGSLLDCTAPALGSKGPFAPRLLLPASAPTYLAPELGILQCDDRQSLRGARLNGVASRIEAVAPGLWHGTTEEGRALTICAQPGPGRDALAINGHLAVAARLRPRPARFDSRWFGHYRNGYRIEVGPGGDSGGVVQVCSDYSGTVADALVLGPNLVATDMGLMVFGGPVSRARLRLLGTATFRRAPGAG